MFHLFCPRHEFVTFVFIFFFYKNTWHLHANFRVSISSSFKRGFHDKENTAEISEIRAALLF